MTMGELETVKNRFGQTKLEAMKEYGLVPDLESAKRAPESIKNFVEMHVEQGPVLDRENMEIGLIKYLAGNRTLYDPFPRADCGFYRSDGQPEGCTGCSSPFYHHV